MSLILPHVDTERWAAIQLAMQQPRSSIEAWHDLMLECGLKPDETWRLEAFEAFIQTLSEPEQARFFQSTLPFLMELIPLCEHMKAPRLLLQDHNDTVHISRTDVAIILACGFFNLFPDQTVNINVKLPFNTYNFADACYFAARSNSQKTKFKCFFNYIECVKSRWNEFKSEYITLQRKCLSISEKKFIKSGLSTVESVCTMNNNSGSESGKVRSSDDDICTSRMSMSMVPLHVISEVSAGGIMDSTDAIQIDFANEYIGKFLNTNILPCMYHTVERTNFSDFTHCYICLKHIKHHIYIYLIEGGGALAGGNAQEEIMFSVKTELLISEFICEVMLPHEAITVMGRDLVN